MISLLYMNLSSIRWNSLEYYIDIVSDEEKNKIYKLRFEKDRLLSLGGKVLLSKALYQLGISKTDKLPPIGYNNYGKPYIKDFDIWFNISHTSSFVVCAISDQGDIGVDIENIRAIDIEEYRQILTTSEYQKLKTGSFEDFFHLWTTKEAVMKAEGKGFFMDPLSISVDLSNTSNRICIDTNIWFIETLRVQNNIIKIASTSLEKAIAKEICLFR